MIDSLRELVVMSNEDDDAMIDSLSSWCSRVGIHIYLLIKERETTPFIICIA